MADGTAPGRDRLRETLGRGDAGGAAIDIGTNIGVFTALVASTGAASVHSFEPVPHTFHRLEQHCGRLPAVLNMMAVTERTGTVRKTRMVQGSAVNRMTDGRIP